MCNKSRKLILSATGLYKLFDHTQLVTDNFPYLFFKGNGNLWGDRGWLIFHRGEGRGEVKGKGAKKEEVGGWYKGCNEKNVATRYSSLVAMQCNIHYKKEIKT